MELIIIGSGTGVPSLRRGAPALAVRTGGRLLLLDLGSGTCGRCCATTSTSDIDLWP
jgi:ribonuclease BN (tRNA processing enzyme)